MSTVSYSKSEFYILYKALVTYQNLAGRPPDCLDDQPNYSISGDKSGQQSYC